MTRVPESASPVETVQPRKYRFLIAALIMAAHLSVGLNIFTISPLLGDVIRDYEINRGAAGLLIALALLISAIFGLPGGVVITRLGLTRSYTLGWWLIGLATLSFLAPNYISLLALRLSFGLGFALVLIATGPLLLQWFRPKEVLVMNGLNTAVLSLGIALSIATAAPLAGIIGWQNSLSVFGAIGLLGAAAWTVLGRTPSEAARTSNSIPFKEIARLIRNRQIVLLILADGGVLVQYTALTAWLPEFYTEVRGMSPTQAGFVTGLLPFIGVFAVLLGGFLPLRFGTPRSYFIWPGILVAIGGPSSFLLGSPAGIYLGLLMVGIGSWMYVPTLLSRTMELTGRDPERVALVWGLLITFAGLGMFVAPIMVGVLRDLTGGFLPGFLISSVAALGLLIAGIGMPRGRVRPEDVSSGR
jgi:cyanate permease